MIHDDSNNCIFIRKATQKLLAPKVMNDELYCLMLSKLPFLFVPRSCL